MAYDNVCNECILKMFDQCKIMVCPHCPFSQLIGVTQNSKLHMNRFNSYSQTLLENIRE